jgi:hypothetical protein
MRLIFILWLVVILYSLSQLRMLVSSDVGGWIGRSVGFGLPVLGIYYLAQWARRKISRSQKG